MPRRPVLWCAAGYAAGILLPSFEIAARAWAESAAVLLAGALALALAARTLGALRMAACLAVLGTLCAGRLAAGAASRSLPGEIDWLVAQHPALFSDGVELAGAIRSPPRRSSGWVAGEEWVVDLESVRLLGRLVPARGAVRLWVPAIGPTASGAQRCDALSTFARLHAPRRYSNLGAFDYPRHLLARGVRAVGTVKSGRLHRVLAREDVTAACRLLRRADRLRAAILIRIEGAFDASPSGRRAAAVSSALLIGERRGLAREDEALLQSAGLSHLLAVSGFNVALLAGLVVLLLRGLGLRRRSAALPAIPVLLIYLAINQEESSVVRAVVMALALLAGRLLQRRASSLNTLGLAALVILAASPLQAHDPGFQLTFAATLPLVLVTRRRAAQGARGAALRAPTRSAVAVLRAGVAASLAAVVVTQPLTALHFNRVTPGAVAANLLAAPMMAGAFTGALALQAIPARLEAASAAVSTLIVWMVDGTLAVARGVSSVPWLTYRRPTPGAPLMAAYYGGLAIFLLARGPGAGRPTWRKAALGLWMPGFVALVAPMDTRQPADGLRVTVLDVGQGDAILIEAPGGPRLLVDAGGSALGEFDVGERVVSPALWRLGLAALDLVIVTHADADHMGGAPSVVRNFRPRQIWVPWGPIGAGARLTDLRTGAREVGARWHEAARGERVSWRELSLTVLHPPAGSDTAAADNERSLVLMVRWNGRAVLLAGDAGVAAESELRGPDLRADALKVGHHGSRTSSSQGFLDAVRPRVALISCGRDNRFGHPHRDVLERLHRAGAVTCRTDRHGAITLELTGDGTRVPQDCALDDARSIGP